MPDTVTYLAYRTLQQGKNYFGFAHKTLSNQLRQWVSPALQDNTQPLSLDTLQLLQERINALLEQDWKDGEKGIYPTDLLFDNPWSDVLRHYPEIWIDYVQTWPRVSERRYQDFSHDVETAGLPQYYLQNFHFQTDGYLSEQSANLYDLQVEILFSGTADPMRRRVLAPLKAGLGAMTSTETDQVKVLDIACGTGRTLNMVRSALPQASLYGVDLSAAYLRKANRLLARQSGTLPQLVQANAESLPFVDNYFDATLSVFLFHELPAGVRQTVIDDAYRVTKPGGTFIICDSIQLEDVPELEGVLENFPTLFHEPYYRHYTTDDIGARLEQAGFEAVTEQVHFMSKYWICRKPV